MSLSQTTESLTVLRSANRFTSDSPLASLLLFRNPAPAGGNGHFLPGKARNAAGATRIVISEVSLR